MRRPLRVFRELGSADGRLGFYTTETRDRIPNEPGFYAWFLPLWIYDTDLKNLMRMVNEVYSYDSDRKKNLVARFTWQSINLSVQPEAQTRKISDVTWRKLLADEEAKTALEQLLLEASIFMPPLYVGQTTNLKTRYSQHVTHPTDRNEFRSRFAQFMDNSDLPLRVSDLLFGCVTTGGRMAEKLNQFEKVEELIEQILMQFSRPPFSVK